MRVPFYFVLFCLIAMGVSVDAQSWHITEHHVAKQSADKSVLTLEVSTPTGGRRHIQAVLPITNVKEVYVYRSLGVVLAAAGNSDLVAIFDLAKGGKPIWFFCYQPKSISGRWLAYIEWYPNHSTANYTDVVLVYDLAESLSRNDLQAVFLRDQYPFRVGAPVYPRWNAEHSSYLNTVENGGLASHILGTPFAQLSKQRLAFMVAHGDDFAHLTSQIVVIDLSGGDLSGKPILEGHVPLDQVKTNGKNPHYRDVTRIEELPNGKLKLSVPKWEYGVSEIIANVPE